MIIIWLMTLLNLMLGYVIKDYTNSNMYLTYAFIFLSSILLFFVIVKGYIKFLFVIFTSYLLRVFFLFLDLYFYNEKLLPHSGDDTENFYKTGLTISQNTSLLEGDIYGGVYSKFIGIIFNIYGDDRLFIQYLNILIAITTILLVIRILRKLNISAKAQIIAILLMSFFPHSLIFSSILLRESLISLLVVLGVYFLLNWFEKGGLTNIIFSLLFVLIGASLHSAIIGLGIGFIFAFVFYKRSVRKFVFSVHSIIPFAIVSVGMTYILIFPEIISVLPFLNKFEQILNNNENIFEVMSGGGRGGSAYLSGLEIHNIFQLILFSPLKMIYFIASPMPWDIRNLNDIFSLFLDSIFYIFSVYMLFKNIHIIKKNPFILVLVICFIITSFIFGVGISNAGTALRHRFKLFSILIIILSFIWTNKKGR